MNQSIESAKSRFQKYASPEPNTGCWLWSGGSNNGRYGHLRIGSKFVSAHRYSWLIHRGEIGRGQVICHHCDVPMCVNPDHLFVGTQADNVADMTAKGRRASFSGSANGRAKLTKEQAASIRSDDRVNRVIARDYGVSFSLIWHIKKGRIWNE